MNNFIVTLDQLLTVSNTIRTNASKNQEYNQLLDDYICNQYDIADMRDNLYKLFAKFKSARYLYDFPVESNIKISSNYVLREEEVQRSTTSQIENAIERYVDKQLLTTEIYNSILKVSYKLTGDEVVYFINTFLSRKSEEEISEIIGVSRTYLQKIKKSCIVKLWVNLEKYCIEDD